MLFVTPGLSPTLAIEFLAILFIKDDFPTLGIPTTIALSTILTKPLFFILSCFSFNNSFNVGFILFNPSPVTEFTAKTFILSCDKEFIHFLVTLSSAKSFLFKRIILGLLPHISSISGFLLELTILASLISIMASTIFKLSFICLRVFAI